MDGRSLFFEPEYASRDAVPVLDLALPRPVQALHQIELSSFCNLRCVYCVSPKLQRPKVHMSEAHFVAALAHAGHYIAQGTQDQINMAGIGESTLHPRFVEFLRLARLTLPRTTFLFATNGLLMTHELAKALAEIQGVFCWVSLHRPEKAGPAIEIAKRYGIFAGTSSDPAVNANNWAGQVDWFETNNTVIPCRWLRYGLSMAMADGRVTACCLDGAGAGVIGHVEDPVGSLVTRPYPLCSTCHHEIGVRGHAQHEVNP